ncbi:hypothetical protein OG417_31750 [Actinoallomurus sp. NBC_01490]|uniref:hypothetical protein n=1 Tax=Actinoallomurus sp. NBC_01490 TaxID=2903557 RepID=UPI002E2FBD04|nr:hypothetical protein [Actinoallomurus sp. NBC_01490]
MCRYRAVPSAATAPGRPPDRVAAALEIRRRPAIADPLVLRAVADRTYTLTARPDRLSPAQRPALDRPG